MRDPAATHKAMTAVKSENTTPEMALRRALWKRGMRYRVNDRKLPGKPDIVFSKAKIIVFCDGDYWHGHNWALRGYASLEEELARYGEYWHKKIRRNVERDTLNNQLLSEAGWLVIRIWGSEIKADVEKCADQVHQAYSNRMHHSDG